MKGNTWKLNAHSKQHTKYTCDICEKTFINKDTKSKHIKIVHENQKLYCHYFNNGTVCPFEKDCVFIHKISEMCKYGDNCERQMCMFRHGDGAIESIDEEDELVTQNKTFINPAHVDLPSESVAFDLLAPCRVGIDRYDHTDTDTDYPLWIHIKPIPIPI